MSVREAIRRKYKADTFLPELYEHRGDTNAKLGFYRDAIGAEKIAAEKKE